MKQRIQNFLRGELIGLPIEAPLKKIKGKFTNTWSISSFQTQTEEFKQPDIGKEAYE